MASFNSLTFNTLLFAVDMRSSYLQRKVTDEKHITLANLIFASPSSTVVVPIYIPGQTLQPTPNGKYSKCCHLQSTKLPSNLSRMNFSRSFQSPGSRAVAHALKRTRVLGSMS
ncbi:unnamed protein product [Malus baccata var. baccata]